MRRGAQRQADQGSRCLTGAKRREFSETPPAASTAGCPQRSGGTQHAGSPFFGSFLWRSKERDSPAGAKSPPPDSTAAAQRKAAAPTISRVRPSPPPSPRGRGSNAGQPRSRRNSRARPSPPPSPSGRGSKTGQPGRCHTRHLGMASRAWPSPPPSPRGRGNKSGQPTHASHDRHTPCCTPTRPDGAKQHPRFFPRAKCERMLPLHYRLTQRRQHRPSPHIQNP